MANTTPQPLYYWELPSTLVQIGLVVPGLVWMSVENIAPRGFDSQTAQPIVNCYTNYAIPANYTQLLDVFWWKTSIWCSKIGISHSASQAVQSVFLICKQTVLTKNTKSSVKTNTIKLFIHFQTALTQTYNTISHWKCCLLSSNMIWSTQVPYQNYSPL